MMENKGLWPATEAAVKQKIDEVAQGQENDEKKMISALRTCTFAHIVTKYVHRIQRDSILKIGMKLYRKKINVRHQINGKELHRWCFVTDV